jgi:hypothetical protein
MQIPPYLLNEHYDDRYFDVVNAIEEAKHIFFRGSGIMDILSAKGSGRRVLRIGETVSAQAAYLWPSWIFWTIAASQI